MNNNVHFKNVSIIVLNYNKWEYLIECITSVLKIEFSGKINIVIVDNASENNSVSKTLDFFNSYSEQPKYNYKSSTITPYKIINKYNIVLLEAANNNGFAWGNNIGLAYASEHFDSEYYWLLSNDTKIHSNTLSILVSEAEENKSIGILGSTLLEYDFPNTVQAMAGKYNPITGRAGLLQKGMSIDKLHQFPSLQFEIDFPIGASLFLRKEFLDSVGYMEECYYLYFEELDWIHRGKKKGWKIAVATQSLVLHKGGGTVSKKSKLMDYFSLRSRILFTKKFYPYLLSFIYATSLMYIINRLFRKQFDRILPSLKIMLNPKVSISNCISWANNK